MLFLTQVKIIVRAGQFHHVPAPFTDWSDNQIGAVSRQLCGEDRHQDHFSFISIRSETVLTDRLAPCASRRTSRAD